MSRSYKKVSYSGDTKGKSKKRIANHKVGSYFKRYPDAKISRGDYRKIQNPLDICDYYSICTWEEFWQSELERYEWLKNLGMNVKKPNEKESYRDWHTRYRMK